MIPNHLFDSAQSDKLKRFCGKVYINALLQLPATMFKDEAQAKSILILQKRRRCKAAETSAFGESSFLCEPAGDAGDDGKIGSMDSKEK